MGRISVDCGAGITHPFWRFCTIATISTATGCGSYSKGPRLELPEVPTPLAELNSPYDDYNSAAPDEAGGLLIFSTNRGSKGEHYDLYQSRLGFAGTKVEIAEPKPFATAAMSPKDELGPFAIDDTLVIASNRDGGRGGLDLYRTDLSGRAKIQPLEGINTSAHEGYWTAPTNSDWGIFASDRGGDLDAYKVVPALGGPNATVARIAELSTNGADDTAFYIPPSKKSYVLFASNREGGKGDYDLYCAPIEHDGTIGPVVHLDYASSPNKDYRPIAIPGHHHDALVFSSNRAGGKGGMDLYYAKLKGCTASP